MEKTKRVLWAKTTLVLCAQVWRDLVCQRWADCSFRLQKKRFHPLHLFNMSSVVLVKILGEIRLCEGNGWPVIIRGYSQCLALHFLIYSSQFLSATAQGDAAFPSRTPRKRAWLGFIFMMSIFFLQESAKITQAALCKRRHKHRSASVHASMTANEKTPRSNTPAQP